MSNRLTQLTNVYLSMKKIIISASMLFNTFLYSQNKQFNRYKVFCEIEVFNMNKVFVFFCIIMLNVTFVLGQKSETKIVFVI
jgi:hypothetical protein